VRVLRAADRGRPPGRHHVFAARQGNDDEGQHPIVFGHCVKIFYKEAFEKHGKLFEELGVNVNNGMVDLYNKIAKLPQSQQDEIKRDLHACQEHRPELAMVDSSKGITNFHSPNDVIVDASMPAMIRNGGKMYGADGRLKEVKAVMPESTFARIYQEMINFCKTHGASIRRPWARCRMSA
jgi:isocitrate dehydrogenase